MNAYYIYILTNHARTLYIGVTNNLERRILEHRQGEIPGFTQRYRIHRLAYYEQTNSIHAAINREKELKGWSRAKKVALIESTNPHWLDLAEDWYGPEQLSPEPADEARSFASGQPAYRATVAQDDKLGNDSRPTAARPSTADRSSPTGT